MGTGLSLTGDSPFTPQAPPPRRIAFGVPRGPRPLQVFSAGFSAGAQPAGDGSSSPWAWSRSTDSFAARGPRERGPACVLPQLRRAQRAPSSGTGARRASPRLPRQVLALSPGRCGAKQAAGTERVTASLIYLPRIKQTLTPALNADCGISQDDRRAAVSLELLSVGFLQDRCLAWLLGTLEATLEYSVAVLQKVKPRVTPRPSSSTPGGTVVHTDMRS